MLCKIVRKGARGFATVVFMTADSLGLVDIESIRETGMQAICGTSCCVAKAINPSAERMKKLKADVKETDDTVIVTIEVPGVEKEDWISRRPMIRFPSRLKRPWRRKVSASRNTICLAAISNCIAASREKKARPLTITAY